MAGIVLVVVGFLELLASLQIGIPIQPGYTFLFAGDAPAWLGSLLLLACGSVLALGVRRESGIGGRSVFARAALIAFGARDLIGQLHGLLPVGLDPQSVSRQILLSFAVSAVLVAATVAAPIVVLRTHVVHGPVRWALVPLAIVDLLITSSMFIPGVGLVLLAARADVLRAAALLAAGCVFALHGRWAVVRRRGRLIARGR